MSHFRDRNYSNPSAVPKPLGRSRPHHHQHASASAQPIERHHHQGWSSTGLNNYDAIFDTEPSSSIRKVRGVEDTSKGIRGRKFGYAFIGRESEQYVREELRNQLAPVSVLSNPGETNASSPQIPANLTPRMIVEEYKRAGHFDTARNQFRSLFESSDHKEFSEHREFLFEALQTYLLNRIKKMTPEARQKMAAKPDKLQLSELTNWIEESPEAAKIIDDLMRRLRGREGRDDSLFGSKGTIGKPLESRLYDVMQSEKRRIDRRKDDSDDEEGNSTPLNKESVTPRGSHTPMTLEQEQA